MEKQREGKAFSKIRILSTGQIGHITFQETLNPDTEYIVRVKGKGMGYYSIGKIKGKQLELCTSRNTII